MKLTIGMPVHGAIDCCERAVNCILSCMKANNYDYDFNIIDDNSDKETKEKLEIICSENNINLYHTEDYIDIINPNLGWNVNFLMDKVKPEDDYYLNVESDVFIFDNTIPELIKCMDKRSEVVAVHPLLLGIYDNTIDWAGGSFEPIIKPEAIRSQYIQLATLSCLLIRGEVARNKEIRVDERFRLWYCDVDLSLQIQKVTGKKIYYTCLSKAKHVHHASSKALSDWPGILTNEEACAIFSEKWGIVR